MKSADYCGAPEAGPKLHPWQKVTGLARGAFLLFGAGRASLLKRISMIIEMRRYKTKPGKMKENVGRPSWRTS
jgi:hypothetical protein